MAITLIVEDGTGKSDSNSYVSREDSTSYLEIEGSDVWVNLADADKDLMLARATRLIDRYCEFTGDALTSVQALEYPRVNAFDYSLPRESDRSLESGIIPKCLKDANTLLAEALASGEYSSKTAGEASVQSLSLPDFNISLGGSGSAQSLGSSLPLPIRVVSLLKPLAYNASGRRLI